MTSPPRRQFASDNYAGICPAAWEAMQQANSDHAAPYGNDDWTQKASDLLRDIFEIDCEVFFTFNGTASNSLSLASLCRSYHSVIAHQLAHIETDECGGPEFFSNGTKVCRKFAHYYENCLISDCTSPLIILEIPWAIG